VVAGPLAGNGRRTGGRSRDHARARAAGGESAGELLVVGDQTGESSSEGERSSVRARAMHRPVLADGAADGDEPSGDLVEDDRLLVPSSS
jgi:hypothetical protein